MSKQHDHRHRQLPTSIPARRQGFSTLEILFAMMLLGVVLAISVPPLTNPRFRERIRDNAFMDGLKGAIIDQRVRYIREPGTGYNFIVDGKGAVRFNRQGVCYLHLDDPVYRVYIQPDVWVNVLTLADFKNRTSTGQDGFTLSIHKSGRLMARLVFQVATSTFREEYYDP